jgi:hypothetical protein
LIALVAATAYVWWRRPRPELGAVVLLLAALISATDLSLQYFIWLLPFAYLIGESRYLTAFQLLLAIPTLLLYGSVSAAVAPWPRWVAVGVYVPFLDVLWLMCLAGVVLTIRRAGWKNESD